MQSVLILEDEALIAFDLADVVSNTNRRIIGPALSVADARDIIGAEVPDVALLDVNVRDETSWDLAGELLSQGCHVIFFSADEPPTTLGAELAACTFVCKPASTDAILAALSAVE